MLSINQEGFTTHLPMLCSGFLKLFYQESRGCQKLSVLFVPRLGGGMEIYMIELNTYRLRIICLDLDDMEILKDSTWKYEDKMGFTHSMLIDCGDDIACEFFVLCLNQIEHKLEENLLWYRYWIIVNIVDNRIIGGACFKGTPNDNSEVEIGYKIEKNYQNLGYATEAINKLVEWAFEQPGVKNVIAETDNKNYASQRVLQKIGMYMCYENEGRCHWKI